MIHPQVVDRASDVLCTTPQLARCTCAGTTRHWLMSGLSWWNWWMCWYGRRWSHAAGWRTQHTATLKRLCKLSIVSTWTPTNLPRRTLWRSSVSRPATRLVISTAGSASNPKYGRSSRNLTLRLTPRWVRRPTVWVCECVPLLVINFVSVSWFVFLVTDVRAASAAFLFLSHVLLSLHCVCA